MPKQESERKRLGRRLGELRTERSTFRTDWEAICENVLPYRPRWEVTDTRRGDKLSNSLVNSTPIRDLKILSAGLMAGITSPSRQWFNLTTSDPALKDRKPVRVYLDKVEEIIKEVLVRGKWYQALADGCYPDLGLIATAAVFAEEDPETHVRFESLPIGEYFLDVDRNGKVDTCMRERGMTVRQVVQRFGIENVSKQTRMAYENGNRSSLVIVVHAVYPNNEWDARRTHPLNMRFASRWWERNDPDEQSFLKKGGYQEFPVLAPRWNVRAGEVYGRGSPGWEARGDCKALQHQEVTLAKLVDKSADPPMRASENLRHGRSSLLPGDITYISSGNKGVFEPAVVIQPASIAAVESHIMRHEKRIHEAFYVNLWMALLADQRQQRATATEIEHTKTEVMLQLGPLLENLNNGLLEPAIGRTFAILQRNGALPEPPEELQGTEGAVRVEFISILHQAQQMTGLAGVRELIGRVLDLAQAKPTVLDKLDEDKIVDELASMLGVKAELVRSDEQVQAIRAAKAAKLKAEEQGEAMLKATEGIKNVSGADPEQLREVASVMPPAAAAQGGLL